ncbi:hypothetical protein C8R44DRAFT_736321 [Mycena epipterygia]|nr:hypothetical protein C8R44DRAFT_736321 [Mycena epipterygia]
MCAVWVHSSVGARVRCELADDLEVEFAGQNALNRARFLVVVKSWWSSVVYLGAAPDTDHCGSEPSTSEFKRENLSSWEPYSAQSTTAVEQLEVQAFHLKVAFPRKGIHHFQPEPEVKSKPSNHLQEVDTPVRTTSKMGWEDSTALFLPAKIISPKGTPELLVFIRLLHSMWAWLLISGSGRLQFIADRRLFLETPEVDA